MGFQTQVKVNPAPALAGDFASTNPRASYPAPDSGFVTGAAGVTAGRFAWIEAGGKTILNTGSGKPHGFVPRLQQALITAFLAESGTLIPAGQPVDLMRTGDYFVSVTVANATKGQKAFAKLADGTIQPGAAGATIAGYVETDFVFTRDALIGEVGVITL